LRRWRFTRSADGYFLVALMGEPAPATRLTSVPCDPDYLAIKFKLDKRGYGYTAGELAATLRLIADDLEFEEGMDG
jgi:hypothetical protein